MKFFSWLMVFMMFITGCCKSDEHVADALARVADSKDKISLGDIAPYEWDTAYVIGPYQSFDYSAVNGIPRKVKTSLRRLEFYDSWAVLLFTYNQKFVSYSEVSSRLIDELGLKNGTYSPETIVPISLNQY